VIRLAVGGPDWVDAIVLAFVLGGATVGGKWWFPWAARKVGKAAAAGFHEEITTTAVSAALAAVTPTTAVQDEKIGHLVDQLQHISGLLNEDVESGHVLAARLEDLRSAVSELQNSGFSVLARHLDGQASFQARLLDVLQNLGGLRKADMPAILATITPVAVQGEQEDDDGGTGAGQPALDDR